MAALVDRHRPMRITARTPVAGRFEAIARSIVYQQLAGRAAAAIWGRTRAVITGREAATGRVGPFVHAETVLASRRLAPRGLRGCYASPSVHRVRRPDGVRDGP